MTQAKGCKQIQKEFTLETQRPMIFVLLFLGIHYPVMLGEGIRLFTSLEDAVEFMAMQEITQKGFGSSCNGFSHQYMSRHVSGSMVH